MSSIGVSPSVSDSLLQIEQVRTIKLRLQAGLRDLYMNMCAHRDWWWECKCNAIVVCSGLCVHCVASVAQLGERQTEDLKVPGSIPGRGTSLALRPPVAHA